MLASEPKSRFREALISEPRSLVLLATRGVLYFNSMSDSRMLVLLELLLSRWCGTVWFLVPLVLPFCITGSLLKQIEGTRPWSNVLRLLQGCTHILTTVNDQATIAEFYINLLTWQTTTLREKLVPLPPPHQPWWSVHHPFEQCEIWSLFYRFPPHCHVCWCHCPQSVEGKWPASIQFGCSHPEQATNLQCVVISQEYNGCYVWLEMWLWSRQECNRSPT